MRNINFLDRILLELDSALRTVAPPKRRVCSRENPANTQVQAPLSPTEKRHVAGLMRVNHAGEVCAQALYRGQAATAKLVHVRAQMIESALEEIDHLAWCEQRLDELHQHTSYLNPFWYAGSWMIGVFAGLAGDAWSLGFVVETEKQVTAHIEQHLKQLPSDDKKSAAILTQMKTDEMAHATIAEQAGAKVLPALIRGAMYAISKVLTKSSYHL